MGWEGRNSSRRTIETNKERDSRCAIYWLWLWVVLVGVKTIGTRMIVMYAAYGVMGVAWR